MNKFVWMERIYLVRGGCMGRVRGGGGVDHPWVMAGPGAARPSQAREQTCQHP